MRQNAFAAVGLGPARGAYKPSPRTPTWIYGREMERAKDGKGRKERGGKGRKSGLEFRGLAFGG